jgi:light-harvesting complex 1 alpha chain
MIIHFILLSTNRFNWIEGPRPVKAATLDAPIAAPLVITKAG